MGALPVRADRDGREDCGRGETGCGIIPANEITNASTDRIGVGEGECRAVLCPLVGGGWHGFCVFFLALRFAGTGTTGSVALCP